MEKNLQRAFASQRSAPNKRLAEILERVATKYGVRSAELDDEWLGLVNAAGEPNLPFLQKEDGNE